MLLRILRLRSRRAARWVGAALCVMFLLLLVGGFAPAILGSRFCWPTVLGRLTAGFNGRVTTGDVSLGWFSPVVVQGVTAEDRHGRPLAQVDALRTERSLLSLLFNPRDLGVVHVDKPTLHVILRDDGSNLEDALESLLAQSSSEGTVRGSIQITDGSVDVVDEQQSHVARFASMGATIQLPSTDDAQGLVTLDSCRVTVGSQSGDWTARLQWPGGGSSADWSLSTRMQGLGLSCIQALSRRLGADVQVDGVLTADIDCQWNVARSSVTVDVRQADIQPLRLTAPTWLGKDQLRLQSLRVAGSCEVQNGSWQFKQTEVNCDAGRFTMDGQFAWKPTAGTSTWRQLLRSAASAQLQVDGSVDLARLAQTLPNTLRIRDGAAIEAGVVQIHVRGQHQAQPRGWQARIETSELAAVRDGRRFIWRDPLRANLEFEHSEQGWNVRQLACRGSFLALTGAGTPQSGSVEMTCDLDRLVSELRQLLDLGSLQATGALRTQLDWQRGDDGRVAVNATGAIDNLDLATGAGSRWQESRLRATVSLEAEADGQQLAGIRTGRVELSSATDHLELKLLEPVANPGRDAVWSVGGSVSGDVAHWLARVRPFLPGGPVDGSGTMQLEFTSRVSPQHWDTRQLVFHAEPLRFSTSRISVDEQAVHVELDGCWDARLRQGNVPNALFQSSALAFRATDVAWNLESTEARLSGDVSFRADLARAHSSWQLPSAQQNWRVAGTAQGQVSLVQHLGSTKARWSIDLAGAELARRMGTTPADMANVIPTASAATWQTVWREPSLKLAGSGQYDGSRETAQLDQFDVTAADTLRLSAEGRIARPFTQCDVDLKGQATYDLARLVDRLLPQAGVRLSGQDTQSFWLRGPLFHPPQRLVRGVAAAESSPRGLLPEALTGLGGLRWQSAEIFGIAVGSGLVSARLTSGTIDTDVIETPVSQGSLRMVPHVYLNNGPPLMTVDAGQVLTNVSITPGMCQGWLKYLTPLAADATSAEGKFSLSLERAAVPLEQPAAAQVQGTLLVEAARIGPGPLALQLIELGEQVQALLQGRLPAGTSREPIVWVLVPQQKTHFALADGRVHHDRCEFHIGNTVLSTSGSVGLDQSLALVARVPIPDEWLARDRRLAALQGMTLEVPISGSLSRPRLDKRALEQLSTQVLQQSANQLLEEGINRGLQQLLGPKR